MTPNELKTFFVMDTETTGFKAENADIIQVSAIKVENRNGEFVVVGEFDSYINPEYPLPPAIVAFNAREQTGITDELLSQSPLAKEVAPKLEAFLGENPVIVLHNAPFDSKFLEKLYVNNLGHSFKTSAIVDTLTISREHVNSKSHKLGNIFELTEKKHSNRKYSGTDLNFHTSLADSYATLDVLDYLRKTYYQQEMQTPQLEEVGKVNIDYAAMEREKTEEIKRAISPANLSSIMCDNNIKSIVVGLDGNGNIDVTRIKVSFISQGKDLTDYAIDAARGLVGDKKTNTLMITRDLDEKGQFKEFEVTGFAKKGKSESTNLGFETFGELKYKEDVYDFAEMIDNYVEKIKEHDRMATIKKDTKESLGM